MSPFTLGPFAVYLKQQQQQTMLGTGQGISELELMRAVPQGKTTGDAIPLLQRSRSYGRPCTGLKCHPEGGHCLGSSLPLSTPTLGHAYI